MTVVVAFQHLFSNRSFCKLPGPYYHFLRAVRECIGYGRDDYLLAPLVERAHIVSWFGHFLVPFCQHWFVIGRIAGLLPGNLCGSSRVPCRVTGRLETAQPITPGEEFTLRGLDA